MFYSMPAAGCYCATHNKLSVEAWQVLALLGFTTSCQHTVSCENSSGPREKLWVSLLKLALSYHDQFSLKSTETRM